MASNNNVVGDLNEVVDLGSLANNRIANPAPIDCRSSSNLNIMFNYNNADLRHLDQPSHHSRVGRRDGRMHPTRYPLFRKATRDAMCRDKVREPPTRSTYK